MPSGDMKKRGQQLVWLSQASKTLMPKATQHDVDYNKAI
jgi:hypothetical protein